MSFQTFIARLENVTTTTAKEGIAHAVRAKCPVCGSNKSSFSVAELSDGRVLMHAFCCQAEPSDLVGAVGLTLDDVYPPRPISHARGVGGPNVWAALTSLCDSLEVAAMDAAIELHLKTGDVRAALALLDAANAINKQARAAMRAMYNMQKGAK